MNINDNTPENKRLSVELPADLVDLVESEARARMVGRGLLIEHLLRDGISRLAPVTSFFRSDDASD